MEPLTEQVDKGTPPLTRLGYEKRISTDVSQSGRVSIICLIIKRTNASKKRLSKVNT